MGPVSESGERTGRESRRGRKIHSTCEGIFQPGPSRSGQGDSARALELAASVEAPWRSLGIDIHVGFWDRLLERYLGSARAALGKEAETAHTRGLALTFDDAVAFALQEMIAARTP